MESERDPLNSAAAEPVEERREWVLQRLAAGRQLRRSDLEAEFSVSPTTAKRDLQTLREEGCIEFVGSAKAGYYRLVLDSHYAHARASRSATCRYASVGPMNGAT